MKNILIIQPRHCKETSNIKTIKTETTSVSFLCYKSGFRFVELREWDLILIDGCLDNLDSRFLKVIETHSKRFLIL